MKKTIIFWKPNEIKAVENCINKVQKGEFKTYNSVAIWLGLKLNRPVSGVLSKLNEVRKKNNPELIRSFKNKTVKNQVNLPEGFSFEIKPTKVIMHPDRRIEMFY